MFSFFLGSLLRRLAVPIFLLSVALTSATASTFVGNGRSVDVIVAAPKSPGGATNIGKHEAERELVTTQLRSKLNQSLVSEGLRPASQLASATLRVSIGLPELRASTLNEGDSRVWKIEVTCVERKKSASSTTLGDKHEISIKNLADESRQAEIHEAVAKILGGRASMACFGRVPAKS